MRLLMTSLLLINVCYATDFTVGPGNINKTIWGAKAGDNIYVMPGIYNETVSIDRSGITLIGSNAIVNKIWCSGVNDIKISGFTLKGNLNSIGQIIDNPTITIDPKESWTTRRPKVESKYISYMALYNTPYTQGITFKNCKNIRIENCTISNFMVGIDASTSETTITGNTVTNCGYGIWPINTCTNNICNNNLVTGIAVKSGSAYIADNVCDGNGLHGISVSSAGSNGCLITRNSCSNNGFYSETMEFPGSSAFNFYACGPNNRCISNVAIGQMDPTGIDGNGYIIDTSTNGVIFERNIAYRCVRGMALTKTIGNTVIYNTFIENKGAGISYMQAGQIVQHNAFYRNKIGINAQGDYDYNLFHIDDVKVGYFGTPGILASHDSVAYFDILSDYVINYVKKGAR